MDWAVLLAAVPTGVTDTISDIVPIAVPVLVALAGISIAMKVLGKFGVRR